MTHGFNYITDVLSNAAGSAAGARLYDHVDVDFEKHRARSPGGSERRRNISFERQVGGRLGQSGQKGEIERDIPPLAPLPA